jgi:hypothetical protein
MHDGEQLLNYLGERAILGKWLLLDPELRLISVTAVEATWLFLLKHASFLPELMAGRLELPRT